MPTSAVRRTAYAGILAALAYAALKTAWGLGSTVGITDVPAFERFVAGFGDLEWAATWGTVVLSLVAIALLLALVEPWGRPLPRRPLRLAAWLGAAVLAVPGFVGVVTSLLTYAGALGTQDTGMAEWVFLLTYSAFSVLSVALAVAARHRPVDAAPGSRPHSQGRDQMVVSPAPHRIENLEARPDRRRPPRATSRLTPESQPGRSG